MDILRAPKPYDFSNNEQGKFFYSDCISEKCSCLNDRVNSAAVEVEHQNQAMNIRGALKVFKNRAFFKRGRGKFFIQNLSRQNLVTVS